MNDLLCRGFAPAENFIGQFRIKPSAALLAFMYQRIQAFDYDKFDDDMTKYKVNIDPFYST